MNRFNKPTLIVHADWSKSPTKRWQAQARLTNGRYHLAAPTRVDSLDTWFVRLRAAAGDDGPIFIGFDFPIGLPYLYAQMAGIKRFLDWLPEAGRGRWRNLYTPAKTAAEINLQRPFYPQSPGGTKQQHLLHGLNVGHIDALRRQCDLPTANRRAAAPLFWTMGAQQVGKAAITGWRDLIAPALRAGNPPVTIWPFSGPLHTLLQPGHVVLAETYPAEVYDWLGVSFDGAGGKRMHEARQANAAAMLAAAHAMGAEPSDALRVTIEDGFGPHAAGEDLFDAVIGLLGMLQIVTGKRPLTEPTAPHLRHVEGWILGQVP